MTNDKIDTDSINDSATSMAELDREAIKQQILNFKGSFEMDFTDDFLNNLSVFRLRHILMAARLQKQKNQNH